VSLISGAWVDAMRDDPAFIQEGNLLANPSFGSLSPERVVVQQPIEADDGQPSAAETRTAFPVDPSLTTLSTDTLFDEPTLQDIQELLPILLAFEREDGELDIDFARRLYMSSLMGDSLAMVGGHRVPTQQQMAQLSGAPEFELRTDGAFRALL
jgi:hypothetical protein